MNDILKIDDRERIGRFETIWYFNYSIPAVNKK